MTIALFTAFSPESGGGAAQIRSVLPELIDLDVKWYYLAPKRARTPSAEWLGPPSSALSFLADLLGRAWSMPLRRTGSSRLADRMDGDVYWVVLHNEGVSLAHHLIRIGKQVHVSVHDDPEVVFSQSRKYRPFKFAVQPVFGQVLRTASSIDVIGTGMQRRYQKEYGVTASVLYRYASALPEIESAPPHRELRVGLIGHVYESSPFAAFIQACQRYADAAERPLRIVTIGSSPHVGRFAAKYPRCFSPHGQLDEPDAVNVLTTCDFVYAMYPYDTTSQRFRQTSVPMKVSTYILAQRPIFAHAPRDSSLAQIVARYGIGVVCETSEAAPLGRSISEVLCASRDREVFERARSALLGPRQVQGLRAALAGGRGAALRTGPSVWP